jgi:curved DNA-binding protein
MDYYAILGVDKKATPEEIKKAYRKLASQNHPDKGGDTSTFQKIQEAYSVLGDSNKKHQYDNPRQHTPHPNMGQGFGQQSNRNPFEEMFGVNGFFRDFFNDARKQQQQQRQNIYRIILDISLLEAYTGTKKILEMETTNGKKILDIELPRGVSNGDQVKIGKNQTGFDSLDVLVKVRKDLRFERRDHDLYCNQSIDVLDLVTGCKLPFTTIDGRKLEVTVNPKTQPYMQIKIPGYGMPILNTSMYGDQYLLLKPYMSDNISPEIIESILKNRGQ